VLCWYQRILMYPLVLILLSGIWRRDEQIHWYVLPFSILGVATSLYHHLLIRTDWFPPPPCTVGIPCTVDYLNWLGFITIPFLALTAFVVISCMMVAWSLLRRPLDSSSTLDGARLAAIMIPAGVALCFMVASTFV
jgi:disulfide bond formation protein DsbB